MGWLVFLLVAVVGVVAVLFPRESDLEQLNEEVRALNQALTTAQTQMAAYAAAEADAAKWRASYATESDEDPTIMGVVDGHITTARQYATTARENLARAGNPRGEYAEYSEAEHQAAKSAREAAGVAVTNARIGVAELQAVPRLADDVLTTYVRTFIWFEIDSWWTSEAAEYPSGEACYYGEVVSVVNPDGSIKETIVDDGNVESWKTFATEDYDELVRQGIVPPMQDPSPDREDVGRYLCGDSPQSGAYGALGEPEVTLVKERGQLAFSQEDENALVGNYQYGAWCVPSPQGTPQALPEPEDEQVPANAEWCWHMPQGDDPRYYYQGYYNNGIWAYSRGPRRCYDCSAQAWTGGTLVPSAQMAQATGADVPNTRPGVQDGGPGTGK